MSPLPYTITVRSLGPPPSMADVTARIVALAEHHARLVRDGDRRAARVGERLVSAALDAAATGLHLLDGGKLPGE